MLMLMLLAAAAAPDGKTMMQDDWHTLSIYGVGGDAGGPVYLQTHAGDLDGDGVSDDAYVKLDCADGKLARALYQIAPRDAASGQASGKRMHKPVTFVKEWSAATSELAAMKASYDVKKVEGTGARAAADSWSPLVLNGTDGLCPAAQAVVRATKTRSNIQNT